LASGFQANCGITDDNTTLCFGANSGYGELTPPVGVQFSAIALSRSHTCAIRTSDSKAQCWGYAIGWNTPASALQTIDAGYEAFCSITTDTSVVCWQNYTSVSGMVATTASSHPLPQYFVNVPGGTGWLQVSVNYYHACALRNTGSVSCWGNSNFVTFTPPADTLFDFVETGYKFTCGITQGDRYLVCWGALIPAMPSNVSISSITCAQSGSFCCLKYLDDTLQCFGDNENGQLEVPCGKLLYLI
jgi:hypothetical protein